MEQRGKDLCKTQMYREAGGTVGKVERHRHLWQRHRMSGYAEARTHVAALTVNSGMCIRHFMEVDAGHEDCHLMMKGLECQVEAFGFYLKLSFSKCDPWTSSLGSTSTTWELTRNANSQSHPRPTK